MNSPLPIAKTSGLVATNTLPHRVKATSHDGRTVVSNWDHRLATYDNHVAAVRRLYPEGTEIRMLSETWRGYTFTVKQA